MNDYEIGLEVQKWCEYIQEIMNLHQPTFTKEADLNLKFELVYQLLTYFLNKFSTLYIT